MQQFVLPTKFTNVLSYQETELLGRVVYHFIHILPIHQFGGRYFILPFWSRNSIIVLLLLSPRTALTVSPVISLPDNLQMIPSFGSASLVDPWCFHSSLTNRFSSTSHSMFIYDGHSSSWSNIILSWCPRTWLNSIASGMDVHTLLIDHNISACFLCCCTICTFLDNKKKYFSLSHSTWTLLFVTPWKGYTTRKKAKPPYIHISSNC